MFYIFTDILIYTWNQCHWLAVKYQVLLGTDLKKGVPHHCQQVPFQSMKVAKSKIVWFHEQQIICQDTLLFLLRMACNNVLICAHCDRRQSSLLHSHWENDHTWISVMKHKNWHLKSLCLLGPNLVIIAQPQAEEDSAVRPLWQVMPVIG